MRLLEEQLKGELLPYDGSSVYYGKVMSEIDADKYFRLLFKTIEWKNDEAVIFGKHIVTRRQAAWYGDENYEYTYSNVTKKALVWTQGLAEIKLLVEKYSDTKFNSCLLNLYPDGDTGMSWHSDDETELGRDTTIASLSLGADRKFMFKHKSTNEKVSIVLESGSLLIMQGKTQRNWLHSLPKTKAVNDSRINLTFRTIISSVNDK